MKKLSLLIFFIQCFAAYSQTGVNTEWVWVNGDSSAPFHFGIYGTKGVSSPLNKPGSRVNAITWTDPSGKLWLFGGSGFGASAGGSLNDLWKYDLVTNEWTWVSGTSAVFQDGIYGTQGFPNPAVMPGSRYSGIGWTDASGNLWLFGGNGNSTGATYLNDLWKYDPVFNVWTWVRGSFAQFPPAVYGTQGVASVLNDPCGREGASGWQDLNGNFWMFGGLGYIGSPSPNGFMNELWKYNPGTNEWTWMKGTVTLNQPGVYGSQTIPDILNNPGPRSGASSWTDNIGNLWMFGGAGYAANSTIQGGLNDVWKYDILSNAWTWMKGDSTINANAVYGSKGIPDVLNKPPIGTASTCGWKDVYGNFWLFGGVQNKPDGSVKRLNDLWTYNIQSNNWTWMKGDSAGNQYGIYGSLGVPNVLNTPGGRSSPQSWTDNSNNLWLFGGIGLAASGYAYSYVNDLWKINGNLLILPLTLLTFNGSADNNENILHWQTAQEINTSHFIIERSPDAVNFTAIGSRLAAGNSSGKTDYYFTDKQPLPGIGFYRLKMYDIDAKFSYSITVAIKRHAGQQDITLFPNPVKDILYVQSLGLNEQGIVQVFDVTGKKIKECTIQFNGNTSFSIPVSDLAKGTYLLLIKGAYITIQQKFVKE